MKKFVLALTFGGLASVASAQVVPEAVVSWDVEFYVAGVAPGVGSPISTSNFAKSTATCGVPTVGLPGGTIVSPTKIRVDDPLNVGLDCILGPTTSAGLLLALPLGNGIFGVAIARGATLVSARSAASNPFNRAIVPAPPIVPTNLRVLP